MLGCQVLLIVLRVVVVVVGGEDTGLISRLRLPNSGSGHMGLQVDGCGRKGEVGIQTQRDFSKHVRG